MKLTAKETLHFNTCLEDITSDELVQSMREFTQHGGVSTYNHVENVARMSYKIADKLNIRIDTDSMVRGAFLHDFYLYDWHLNPKSHRRHGFYHAGTALCNAESRFDLNEKERNIIYSHMWPLNLTHLPKTREAFIVTVADKLCALNEVFGSLKRRIRFRKRAVETGD